MPAPFHQDIHAKDQEASEGNEEEGGGTHQRLPPQVPGLEAAVEAPGGVSREAATAAAASKAMLRLLGS